MEWIKNFMSMEMKAVIFTDSGPDTTLKFDFTYRILISKIITFYSQGRLM